MRKLLIGCALAMPLAFAAVPAKAFTAFGHGTAPQVSDVIEVKGGHGRGGGHGWGRGHGARSFGWSRGRKIGWRGRGCPPGLWKQGRC